MFFTTILIAILIHHVASRSTGPPSEACSTITPQHGESTASNCPQNCPYSLQVVSLNGVPVGPLTGTVGYASASDVFGIDVIASGENIFRGFAVQSRASTNTYNGNEAFQGGFENSESDPVWQLITCDMNTNGTAGHTTSSEKSQVTLYWIPPVQSVNVILWFTIVQAFSTFYVQMEGLRMVPAVFCSQANFCQNNGMCIEANGNFTCNCPPEFAGQNCEISLNPCNSNPCGSSGTCIENGESYFCACSDGETVNTPCVNPTSTAVIMSSSILPMIITTDTSMYMTVPLESTSFTAMTVVRSSVTTDTTSSVMTTVIMNSSTSTDVIQSFATALMPSTTPTTINTFTTVSTDDTSAASVATNLILTSSTIPATSSVIQSTSAMDSSLGTSISTISTFSTQLFPTTVSPTPSPINTPPYLQLLSPQPIRIYGRIPLSIQLNATVTNQFGSSVKANSSLLSVSLILSTNGTISVNIASYNSDTGQLVLTVPSEFYATYVNASFNVSYFEVTLISPISSLTASISFSLEYLDIIDLSTENGRRTFATGENLSMTCITIPPNISVIWEAFYNCGFIELVDPRVQYDPPSTRTRLQLTNLSMNDTTMYRCRGTGGLANVAADNSINILPDTLSIQFSYFFGESSRSLYLVNRSAFVIPSSLTQNGGFQLFCIGILGDSNTEITADSINSTAGFSNNMYDVRSQQLVNDTSGDFVVISFFQFLFSHSGNFTCRSTFSGLERTVFISNNPLGAVAVLLSPSTVRVTLGEDAIFIYRIALVDNQDVINSVQVFITNSEITEAILPTVVDQGNDIYHIIFSNVGSVLNQAEFVLQFNGFTISSTATIAVLPANVSVVPDQFAVSSVWENITLACTPSDMSLSIDWYREGSQLLTASTKYVFSPAVQSHMLTITDVQLNDAASYYCTLADSEINNDWKIELIVVEDPIVMFLNNVQLPPVAVINVQPSSTLTLMCAGTERFTLASSNSLLPNPVAPGYYSDTEGGVTFSVTAFNNLIVLDISNINELPDAIESFNCTSLESSAAARLFFTSESLFVASLIEDMAVFYGEPFTISYTIASSSNGTDNVFNETLNLFIEFENTMTDEPINLDLNLLSVISGNFYQLHIPYANSTTTGNYRLIAEAFGRELSASATVSVRNILPRISVVENVYELTGSLARLECSLSFPGISVIPNVPATWYRFDGDSYTDVSQLDNAQLTSDGSQYELLLESVSLNDASRYVCAIVENEMRIAEEYTQLIVFKNKINIGYDSSRLIPSGAIINRFSSSDRSRRSDYRIRRNALPTMPTGVLILDCYTVTGQENPYWEITDNALFNGTILPNLTLQIGDVQTTISIVPVSAYVTVIDFDVFPAQLSGTYTCKSSPNGPNSSVFITTRDPFVQSLVASPLEVPQCKIFDLLFQVAQSSDGTIGSNAIESVQIEQLRNGLSIENSTFSPNQQVITARYTASSSRSGNYYAYLPEEPNVRDSIELAVLYPSATLLTDRNVVSLVGSNITLGCFPSDQILEVRWVMYRNDGTREVLSPNGRTESKRLAIQDNQLIFEPPGLYYQITIINTSLDNTGNYSCEVLPNCSDPLAIAYNMTLTIVPEEVNIGYDGRNLLPSGTVINNFIALDNIGTPAPTTPPPSRRRKNIDHEQKRNVQSDCSFQLECITVMGQENPYWEVSNNLLYNGTIFPNLTLVIGEQEATIFIIAASNYRTIINFNTFYSELSGNYTCRSSSFGPSSSVLITTRNPFVRVLTPTPLNISQCQVSSVVFQAALNSDGLLNSVDLITIELFQSGININNSSYPLSELQSSLQIFQLQILATSSQDGEYYLYLPIDLSERDSFEINVQYPTLSLTNDERISVLRGSFITFECIPSDTTISIRWIFYGPDGSIMRIFPSIRDDSKRQVSPLGLNIEIGPPELFYQLTIYDIQLPATGIFSCEILPPCQDNIIIAQNVSLTVEPACDEDFNVILWPKTPVSSTAMFRCADIHPSFRFGPYVTRVCEEGEKWSPVNFTQCTVRSGSIPLLMVSVILQGLSEVTETPNPIMIQNQIINDTVFTEGVTVTLQYEEDQDQYLVFILIELPSALVNEINIMAIGDYFNSPTPYGSVRRLSSAILTVFEPSDICYCNAPLAVSDDTDDAKFISPALVNVVNVCIGYALPPCICNATTCKCKSPAYSGNGTVCARDSDQDTLPDVDLGCNKIFCEEDACPLMQSLLPNGTQDVSICRPISEEELSCAEETDEYSVVWPASAANTNITLSCPGGTGSATRFCDDVGRWEPPNVRGCRSYEYIVIAGEAQALSTAMSPELVAEMSMDIIDSLATITGQTESTSALPLDLGTTVDILDSVLSTANSSGAIGQEEFVDDVLQVYNNVLNTNNTPGWMDLQQINRTQSQILLLNAEEFSVQWASTFEISENRTIATENIVISAEAVDIDNEENILDVFWPTPGIKEEAEIFKSTVPFASVMIPGDLIRRRGMISENRVTLIANIAYRNFASILPSSTNVTNRQSGVTQAVSLILSSQVTAVGSSLSVPPTNEDPVVLMFEYSSNESDTNLRCGFWDFELDQGSDIAPGGWSSDGLSVELVDDQSITCSSTHLTSFAVLVDVSGGSQNISDAQKTALSAVTYIGASISLLCVTIAIIMFIVYRKTLLKGLHNFIHLNLTIALALALLVFVTGIETATESDGGCTFVAFLLHYFFTAVFTWMLCEGILLYFLLVKVFNTGIGQKKLLYLSIGWGVPIPIVVIAVGIAHDQYGIDEYCWISTDEGAIWAFVVPMLIIIIANVCFLAFALRAVYKSRQLKLSSDESTKVETGKTILKAAVVLLPVLGITWVFGILAVNEESVAFAWIFTILNSFQGVFIFVLHVLRNEKVKGKIKSYFKRKGKYSITTNGESTTSNRFKTTRSNRGFTTKVTVKIDEDMELGAKNCLDDSVAEPKMYANPEVAELNDENPITQTV